MMDKKSQNNGKILVTGTIAFDHLFSYDSEFLEQLRAATTMNMLSVSFQPNRYVKRNGGTGANIAWNIALLGGKPLLVGKVGADGHEYVDLLQERGIDTSGIEVLTSSMTSTGVCCTDTQEHQIWFFYRGADAVGNWPKINASEHNIQYAIIGARNPGKMIEGLSYCQKNNISTLFDPGQYIMDFQINELKEAMSMSTGMIMNAFEWGMLRQRLHSTTEELVNLLEYVIVTHGEDGHIIYKQQKEISFPRCNCDKPVNPTGAGDAFRAGLVLGVTSGWSLEQASQLGAAIASFVVEQEGTLMDSIDINRLHKRVREAYGESLPGLPF